MALPASVTLRPLELTTPAATAATYGTIVLNFVIQPIANAAMTYWAPAAVSASVAAYFNYQTRWSQCQIANSVTGQSSCCSGSPPAACNNSGSFTVAACLTAIGSQAWSGNQATFGQVMSAIEGSAPLAIVLTNPYTPLAIYGYTNPGSGGGSIFIGDPVQGYTIADFTSFPHCYAAGSTWSHTYWTKRANG